MACEGLPSTSKRNFSSPSFSPSSSSDSSQRGSYSRRSRRRSPYCDSSEDESYKKEGSRSNSVEEDNSRRGGDWDLNHNAPECSSKEDRISALADPIILHILSFLPTKDAVKSGTLSRRWAYLWTTIPCLSFSRGNFSVDRFVNFVNATLLRHSQSNVEKFAICFRPTRYHFFDVDRWIRLMTQAKVKELTLDFQVGGRGWDVYHNEDEFYALPKHLYINSSLTKLELSMCGVKPVGGISWNSLKSLSLGWTRLDDGIMRDIIEGCPLLEFLELHNFYGISRLNLTNRNLMKLVIRDHTEPPYPNAEQIVDSTLEISAPYLQSLTMFGETWSGKYRVLNAQYLVDCCLKFFFLSHDLYMLRQLLHDLRHAKALTVGASFIQVLSLMEVKGVSCPLSERKCLKLDACLEDWDLPGLASLLKSSPYLENLIINLTNTSRRMLMFLHDDPIPDGENYWPSQKNFECMLLHLKTISITGIVPENSWNLVLQLIEFLGKNAKFLEKMTVHTRGADRKYFRNGYVSKGLFEVAQKLLSFPKSSPRAVVTFLE